MLRVIPRTAALRAAAFRPIVQFRGMADKRVEDGAQKAGESVSTSPKVCLYYAMLSSLSLTYLPRTHLHSHPLVL